jgi:tetratricopeptide (TPR) repeat protein
MANARAQDRSERFLARNVLITIALMAAAIVCYWPVHDYAFINYDDDVYIIDNPMVRQGLTPAGVAWAFGTFAVANWHPITWLSHMIDASVFGGAPTDAGGHHLVSVIIHAINAALLLWLLNAMTRAFWRSALVAALFALHPLHVESVAWVAERKDVLSTLFGLLTLIIYIRWVRSGEGERAATGRRAITYASMLLVFALGLMSKPMLVTLPFVMLLLDFWPLQRTLKTDRLKQNSQATIWLRLIAEKAPLFAMSLASSVVTMVAQSRSGAVWSTESLSVSSRIANAIVAYGQYLRQTFWPSGLALVYQLPKDTPAVHVAFASAALSAITIMAVLMWKRRPYLIVGWLWFLGTLVPVIGLVQVGPQARADRYTYVPLIGIFIMLAWSLPAAARVLNPSQRATVVRPAVGNAVVVACIAAVVVLSLVTWNYVQKWRDSVTIFAHVLAVTNDNSIAHGNMAAALANLNPPDLAGAIEHNQHALATWPRNAKAAKNMGNALVAAGQPAQAIEYLNLALSIKPEYVEARSDLGAAYARMGQPAQAIEQYQLALAVDPDFVEARSNLGGALVAMQRSPEAVPHLERVVAQNPEYARARFNLACALGELGQTDRSIEEFQRAIALNPNLHDARFNLATMLFRANRVDEAIAQYTALLQINPNHAMAHNGLARALAEAGRYAQAIEHSRAVLALVGENASAMNNLATLLLDATDTTIRNASEALALAQRVCELTSNGDASALNTLGRARAANGDFQGAIDAAQQSLNLAQRAGNASLAEEVRGRIDGYRSGRTSP